MQIQTIFNRVIEAGYYPADEAVELSSNYMCNALYGAIRGGVITSREERIAADAIDAYMVYLQDTYSARSYITLRSLLRAVTGTVPSYSALLDIYKDWDNRPFAEGDES